MEKIFSVSKFLPHCDLELHFEVFPSVVNVITGRNGIGKTSFLNFFADYLGKDKSIVLSQNPESWFYSRRLAVIKDIMLNAGLKDFNQSLFLGLWSSFGLDLLEDRMTEDLSGGEFQSLRITLALARETEYYLFDEPSHYLDSVKTDILSNTFGKMILAGKKIIVVEHDHAWISQPKKFQNFVIENGKLQVGDSWNI